MKSYRIFFLISLFYTGLAQAFSVNHDFLVHIGAFDAASVNFRYQMNPQDYSIRSVVSTNGFFHTLYPFAAQYDTSGRIINEKLISQDYRYISQSRFKNRSKQVMFDDQGLPVSQTVVSNGREKKRSFPPAPSPADTFDLQTIMMKVAYQYNLLGFCAAHLAVYDGKRHFDVETSDLGKENLAANSATPFSGPAHHCAMQITKSLNDDDDTLWEFAANKTIDFWIMPDETSAKPFIARVKIKDTPLGELNAYATKITVED
ncbi:MAG: DUF3108 domain-containing protein [Alphaproteobacteria bacterium]|nr:DUF3108 domain-containing protein [Alphaproteobacteria bacterium]